MLQAPDRRWSPHWGRGCQLIALSVYSLAATFTGAPVLQSPFSTEFLSPFHGRGSGGSQAGGDTYEVEPGGSAGLSSPGYYSAAPLISRSQDSLQWLWPVLEKNWVNNVNLRPMFMLVGIVKPAKAFSILWFCCRPALSEEALWACPFIKNAGVATMDRELQGLKGRFIFGFWVFSSLSVNISKAKAIFSMQERQQSQVLCQLCRVRCAARGPFPLLLKKESQYQDQ